MDSGFNILVISGSTKTDSANRKIIRYLADSNQGIFHMEIFPIASLPFFNPDNDKDGVLPESVARFRAGIQAADAVIVCTPEYVFSLPGVLKNAFDWLVSTMLLDNKPTAAIVASSSGEKAFESVQLILKTLGAKLTTEASLLVSGVKARINERGELIDPDLINDLARLADTLKAGMANR